MEFNEIQEHLKLHKLWINNTKEGKRADLSRADLSRANLYGADLSGANLYGADLYGANLSGADLSQTIMENKAILTFLYNKHTAYYFGDGYIQIGCHKKTISEWIKTYTEVGKSEKYNGDEIEKYGKFIKGCASIQKDMDQIKGKST